MGRRTSSIAVVADSMHVLVLGLSWVVSIKSAAVASLFDQINGFYPIDYVSCLTKITRGALTAARDGRRGDVIVLRHYGHKQRTRLDDSAIRRIFQVPNNPYLSTWRYQLTSSAIYNKKSVGHRCVSAPLIVTALSYIKYSRTNRDAFIATVWHLIQAFEFGSSKALLT